MLISEAKNYFRTAFAAGRLAHAYIVVGPPHGEAADFATFAMQLATCKAGRDAWCADNGLDPATASMTIAEFCRRTCNAYGGEIIRQLAEYMGIELDNPRRR